MQINWDHRVKNYPQNAMMLSSWYVACMVLIVTVIRQNCKHVGILMEY